MATVQDQRGEPGTHGGHRFARPPTLTWSVGQQIHVQRSPPPTPTRRWAAGSRSGWDARSWRTALTRCHEHIIGSFTGVAGGNFAAPDHEYPSHLNLRLTATDGHGATNATEIELHPATRTWRLQSSPSGMSLTAAGVDRLTRRSMSRSSRARERSPVTAASGRGPAVASPTPGPRGPTAGRRATASSSSTSRDAHRDLRGWVRRRAARRPVPQRYRWLVREAITAGCAPALYCPNGLVTRGQMATFLSRALDLPATSTPMTSMTTTPTSTRLL